MKDLSPRQLAVVRRVMETLFDEGSGSLPEERVAFVFASLRPWFARAGLQTQMAFRGALLVVQFSPLLFLRRLQRFVRLGAAERARCLVGIERSRRLGLLMVLLKTALGLHYFEHPEMLARTGYDGEGLLGPAWARDGGSPLPATGSKLQVVGGERHDPHVAEGA